MVAGSNDTMCRRCRVDLITGAPAVPSTKSVQVKSGGATRLDRIKAISKKPKSEISIPAKTAPTIAHGEEIPITHSQPVLSSSTAKNKKRKKHTSLFSQLTKSLKSMKSSGSEIKNVECLECQGNMHVHRIQGYSSHGPIALIILAVVLLFAGLKAWPLFIMAPISLGLGVLYLKKGDTRWQCPSCGFTVTRI
jgi:hypothetical protein